MHASIRAVLRMNQGLMHATPVLYGRAAPWPWQVCEAHRDWVHSTAKWGLLNAFVTYGFETTIK